MGNWVGDEDDWWNKGAGGDEGTNNPDGTDYDARLVPSGGVLRDAYDWAVEYNGTIKGRGDQHDLPGGSASDAADQARESLAVFQKFLKWLREHSTVVGLLVIGVVSSLLALALTWVLRPYAMLLAGGSE